jgi:hypothetical protein
LESLARELPVSAEQVKRPKRGSLDALRAAVEREGEEAVFGLIAAGKTMRQVGEAFGISADSVYAWIREGGDARAELWRDAKLRSADALVDRASEILDDPASAATSSTASMARASADFKRWLAAIRNREEYGEPPPSLGLHLDIGQLHLQALMAHGRPDPEPEVLEGVEVKALPPVTDPS